MYLAKYNQITFTAALSHNDRIERGNLGNLDISCPHFTVETIQLVVLEHLIYIFYGLYPSYDYVGRGNHKNLMLEHSLFFNKLNQ